MEKLARAVVFAMLAFGLMACGSTMVPSPTTSVASAATDPATAVPPSPTLTSSPTASPSQPSASPALTVRTLGKDYLEAESLLQWDIMERSDHNNCLKWTSGERGVGETRLKGYLATATGAERMIGQSVWLGTLEGWARSLDSTEVVVPANGASRLAWIVFYNTAKSDYDSQVGALTAIKLERLDLPAGAIVPDHAEVWMYTGSLIATQKCR